MTTKLSSNDETLLKIQKIIDGVEKIRNRLSIISFIVLLSMLSYFLVDKYFNASKLYQEILVKVSSPTGLLTTVSIVFIIGIALSIFKQKQQFWYGIFETVFALTTCYLTIKGITAESEMLSILVALGSTLYLIVRGLSNIKDGIKNTFWTKSDFVEIGQTINSVSARSILNLLRDRKAIVNFLWRLIKFTTHFT